jgi:phage tail sheath protein FI
VPYTNPTATPGVYIHEGPPASRPIEGVATSVAAFVGLAPAGPVNTPTKVTSWTEFARGFGAGKDGPYLPDAFLAHAVKGFFLNGGTVAWIVRIGTDTAHGLPKAELASTVSGAPAPFEVVLKDGVKAVDDKDKPIPYVLELVEDKAPPPSAAAQKAADDPDAPDPEPVKTYTVTVTGGDANETWGPGLTATPGPRFLATEVSQKSQFVDILPSGGVFQSAELAINATKYPLSVVGDVDPPPAEDLIGQDERMTGLAGIALADEVTIVCLPDLMTLQRSDADVTDVQTKTIDFCAKSRRMAIIDPPPALSNQEIGTWREGVGASEFGALYWPWVQVKDPIGGGVIEVPPCGHVAGAWAGTDATRGVHKAPANVALNGVVGLGFAVTDAMQDSLNRDGINCLRSFPGRGTLIWGARTLNVESEWKYLNVRRLFNYLMASILESTQWAVFEPNDEVLWGQLRVSVSNFLTRTWRTGALFGATPDEAFFVQCDAETNPPDLIEAGQVNVRIGVAPVKPAEFVVFEISQFQPGA